MIASSKEEKREKKGETALALRTSDNGANK